MHKRRRKRGLSLLCDLNLIPNCDFQAFLSLLFFTDRVGMSKKNAGAGMPFFSFRGASPLRPFSSSSPAVKGTRETSLLSSPNVAYFPMHFLGAAAAVAVAGLPSSSAN